MRVRPTAPAVAETPTRRQARAALAQLARQALRGEAPAPELLETFAAVLPLCALGPVRLAALQKQVSQVRAQLAAGAAVGTLVSVLESVYHAAVRAADGGRR